VIFLTGYGDDKFIERAKIVEPFGYILKPFQEKEIKASIEIAIHKKAMEKQLLERYEALKISIRQWEETFDAISDAISLMDLGGKILQCNTPMKNLLGKPSSEIIGCACYELMHNTSEPIEGCPLVRMRESRRRETLILPINDHWFELVTDPLIDEDSNLLGAVHIIANITVRKRAEDELRDSYDHLRHFSAHLQSGREQERISIAHNIHDRLGQPLVALKMFLSLAGKKLPEDQELLIEKSKSMEKMIGIMIDTANRIGDDLRPSLLDEIGLIAAIEWQAEEFQNRTGIKCKVSIDPEDIILDKERSTAFFRIIQETLTNVARHANATEIYISLNEKAGDLVLKVKDNGKGITAEEISHPKSFGLMGIRERVHSLGGKAKIEGIPGKGTTVTVSIPIEE